MLSHFHQMNTESFKPCYKWITFNIEVKIPTKQDAIQVLNLVING